jgi:hypothetical protein
MLQRMGVLGEVLPDGVENLFFESDNTETGGSQWVCSLVDSCLFCTYLALLAVLAIQMSR